MVMATQAANSRDGFVQIWLAGSVLAVTAVSIVVLGAVAYRVGAGVHANCRSFKERNRDDKWMRAKLCRCAFAILGSAPGA
jgi:hypothetical protein